MNYRQILLILSFLILTTSCSTTYTKVEFPDSPSEIGRIYSGTRFNLASWSSRVIPPLDETMKPILIPMAAVELLIDLPFSVVADTLYLPIDLTNDPPRKDPINQRKPRLLKGNDAFSTQKRDVPK